MHMCTIWILCLHRCSHWERQTKHEPMLAKSRNSSKWVGTWEIQCIAKCWSLSGHHLFLNDAAISNRTKIITFFELLRFNYFGTILEQFWNYLPWVELFWNYFGTPVTRWISVVTTCGTIGNSQKWLPPGRNYVRNFWEIDICARTIVELLAELLLFVEL